MVRAQMELALKRERVPMRELENEGMSKADREFGQPHHGHDREEEVELRVRLPKRVAEAVVLSPDEAREHMKAEAQRELDAMCTPWFVELPPVYPGSWQVTDILTGTVRDSAWWDGKQWHVPRTIPSGATGVNIFTHESFKFARAWRGLKECPKAPYPCPPYEVSMLPVGARVTMGRAEMR